MARWFVVCAAVMLYFGSGINADQERKSLTIRGCVWEGARSKTFMLMNVTEVSPAGDSVPAAVFYWLNTTRGLKQHIGETVEITGTVSMRDSGLGRFQTLPVPATDRSIVVIKRGRREVTVGMNLRSSTTEVQQKPVRELKVESVRMVMPSCR